MDEVHARVEKLLERSGCKRRFGRAQVGVRRFHRLDCLLEVELGRVRRAPPQGDALADGVRVAAPEVDQRDLAGTLDPVYVRLHHRRPPPGVERLDVCRRRGRLLRLVAGRGAAAGGENRLDDEAAGRRLERLARLEEERRHDRHACGLELGEVALVRAPAQDRQRVEDARQASGPVEELAPPFGVVPGRANDDEVEAVPVDLRVPHCRYAFDRASRQSGH